MKKFITITLMGLLLSGCVTWTKGDVVREGVWMGLHLVDWKQTRTVAKNPHKYHETNPIMGKHPSVGRVDTYMGAWVILHPVITHVLPEKHRKVWQYISIGVTGGAVVNNICVGVEF